MDTLIPKRGERVLVAGQTGSGKTVAMAAITRALSEGDRVAVLDTKIEPKYRALPRAQIIRHPRDFLSRESRFEKRDGPAIMIWRPSPEIAQSPDMLDDVLYGLYNQYHGNIVIDELYPFHSNGRAGPGMTAILTRGRSRGITTVMGSQRPTWISRFCVTEAQHYWIYRLVDRADRKRIAEVVPEYPQDFLPDKYHFLYYNHSLNAPTLFSPINLSQRVDSISDSEIEDGYKWI